MDLSNNKQQTVDSSDSFWPVKIYNKINLLLFSCLFSFTQKAQTIQTDICPLYVISFEIHHKCTRSERKISIQFVGWILFFSSWTDLVNISEGMRHSIRLVSYIITGLLVSLNIVLYNTGRQKTDFDDSQCRIMRQREEYDRQGQIF